MIPQIMHFVWVGSLIPEEFMQNIWAWDRFNPDWERTLWTEANRPDLYNEHLYTHAEEYVPAHAVGQFRADILRYELLYNYGGFYADVDTVPLRPLGDLFDELTEFAVMEDSRWIANTILASVPHNDVFEDLIHELRPHAERYRGKAAAVVSGPQYLTPIWNDYGAHVDERTELWFPYSWSHVRAGTEASVEISPDAYMIHNWAHQRGLRRDKR